MKQFTFKKMTANVKDLKLHPLLQKFMSNQNLKKAYLQGIEYYQHLEIPVVTKNNEVLTHVADFLAAKELKLKTIEVALCNLQESELPMFSAFKHLYAAKDYTGIYEAIVYFTDYLKEDETGKAWAQRIQGDMDEKLSSILGCSPTHVKRIRSIGKNEPGALELIQQGEKSFNEVLNDMKDRNGAAPAAPAKPSKSPVVNVSKTADEYQFFNATIMTSTGTKFVMSVTESGKTLFINGKKVNEFTHQYYNDDDNGKNTDARSHVFTFTGADDTAVQLIFENPNKLLKLAA